MFGKRANEICDTPNCGNVVYGDGWNHCERCLSADVKGKYNERKKELKKDANKKN